MIKHVASLVCALTFLSLVGCGGGNSTPASGTLAANGATAAPSGKTPKVAYVTNGIAAFWVIADKGAKDAGKKYNAEVSVEMPAEGVGDQKRIVQSLLTRGVDGIAISPIDPVNQADLLNEAAAATKLITHDSDAPSSKRLCYVGMDNYTAGRMCGQLVKEALPEGGKLMIFVGRIEQLNLSLIHI